MESSVESVCDLLVHTRLLTVDEIEALRQRWHSEAPEQASDAGRFAQWLVMNQVLTAYQADRILRGQTDHYFFNQYKLLDRIGQGRMAGVYKAVHPLGQVVAIKVLPPSRARDPQAFGRFQREARLALCLKHRNIVRTFQTGEADKLHYLAMEYLEGETLEEVLKWRKRLPPATAVRLLDQALQGLQHLHEQGIVHRDLKPANLMLVPAPGQSEDDPTLHATVKILDIGVGRALFDEGEPGTPVPQDLTNEGDMLGAPDYMAPEQAKDAHTADVRADIYSLGCVLYHMLTGQPPFPDVNPVQKMIKHASVAPKPLRAFDATLPEGLQAILDRMLAKDPAQRYPTPDQAAKALQRFLAEKKEPERPSEAVLAARQKLHDYEAWLADTDPEAAAVTRSPASSATADLEILPRRHPIALLAAAGAAVVIVGLICGVALWFITRPKSEIIVGPGTFVNLPPGLHEPEDKQQALAAWTKDVAALPAEKQPEAVAAKLQELNPGFDGQIQHQIEDGAVTELQLVSDNVTDLTPLRALPGLKRLACPGSGPGQGKLADLSPLQGLQLATLDCSATRVADLTPLRGMPLCFLGIAGTQVRDLSPVKDMPLLGLNCASTHVTDLSPLEGMELTLLDAADTSVDDLSPLRGMPLQTLWCQVQPLRDTELLRSLSALKEVNGEPVAGLWKQADAQKLTFEDWVKRVAALPPKKRVEEVAAELKRRNPGFDGKVTPRLDGDAVVELRFVSDAVTDISPVRALPELQRLFCNGSQPGKGKLSSLQPLKGMRLTELDCGWSQVRDLTPLKDMPLTRLRIAGNTGVADLSPLGGMPLTLLRLGGNARVHDLTPLKGMPLTQLNIADTQVRDLTPLKGMRLTSLTLYHTQAIDLAPLRGLPLEAISWTLTPLSDTRIVRSIKTLKRINDKPAAEFWKEADAQRQAFEAFVRRVAGLPAEEQVQAVAAELKKRNPGFDGKVDSRIDTLGVTELRFVSDNVRDLSAVRALPKLRTLACPGSAPGSGQVFDLSVLNGLSLRSLDVSCTAVSDLAPLRDIDVETLNLADTPVGDLAALKNLSLKSLNITNTQVADLSALQGMALKELRCTIRSEEDAKVVRSIKTLAMLNGQPTPGMDKPIVVPPRVERAAGPNVVKQRPVPTAHFAGKLIQVSGSEKSLTVQVTQAVVTQSAHHTYWLGWHQLRLLQALRDPNPRRRMWRAQSELYWIAFHRSQLYHAHAQHQNIELMADDDVMVRTLKLPPVFDDKGKPRNYTAKELEKLKGPDRTLPGYSADFALLAPPQLVEVYITRGDLAKAPPRRATRRDPAGNEDAPEGKVVDPRPRVYMIVVLQ
jgi:serine/threonine protein kinase/Leucine-rich repeat (LRR) protein